MKDENRLCLSFFIILLITIIVICIDYTEASAETWCLAGDFNGWDNASHPCLMTGPMVIRLPAMVYIQDSIPFHRQDTMNGRLSNRETGQIISPQVVIHG